MNQYKMAKLNVSETTIQEYFPMESTIEALFKIYESFFDVKFGRQHVATQQPAFATQVNTTSPTAPIALGSNEEEDDQPNLWFKPSTWTQLPRAAVVHVQMTPHKETT